MSTLLRLLKLVHRHRILSNISKIKFEASSADTLLQPRSTFLTNQFISNVSCTPVQDEKRADQLSDIKYKMSELKRQYDFYGKISRFNVNEILSDIKNSGNATSLQGLFLLQCCSESMADVSPKLRQQLADDIWKTLRNLNITLDVSHYNALLHVYIDSEHEFSPLNFLKEMLNANVKPNRVTFQRLIWQFCNQGKVTEANQILEYMNEEKILINEEMLGSLIYGHGVNNDMEGITKTLKNIEELNISPTIKTYSSLLYAYAKMGDIENIKKTLQECDDKEIWVSDKVLLKVVYHLALSNFQEYVDEILSLTSKGPNYTKEANVIMCKLVEKQEEDIAFKIFQSLPNNKEQKKTRGDYFIQTLINFKTPIDKSIKFCRIMEEEGINQQAFLLASRNCLANDMYESSISFMKAWKEIGGTIRMNYFYPIFKAYGEAGQSHEIAKTLREIILNFQIHPTVSLLRTHILPYMQGDMNNVLLSLTNCLVNYETALNAILLHLLSKNDFGEVVKFMSMNYPSYNIALIKHNLLHALRHTEDVPSFVWIVHFLYKGELQKLYQYEDVVKVDKKYLSQQFVDSCVLEALDILSTDNKYLIVMLFRNLVYKCLSLSSEAALEIEKKLNNEIKSEIINDLNALKSGQLIPVPMQTAFSNQNMQKLSDVEKLESTAKLLSVTNKKLAMELRKKILIYYCRIKNEKKVAEILQEIEKQSIDIIEETSGYYYRFVIGMYLDLEKIDKAESLLNKCKEKYEGFQLNRWLIMKMATTLVKYGHVERALEYLASPTTRHLTSIVECNKLLQAVVQYKDEELLQQFYDVLKDHEHLKKSNEIMLLDHFIALHLSRDDGKAALEWCERIYYSTKRLPMKLELMKKFITDGDKESLERVLKMSFNVSGKVKTYFDLAMSHLENNNLDQTKSIIEKHCLNIYEENALSYANKYYANGEIQHLENFFDVLDSLNFDVEKLCVLLLKSYGKQNQWEKSYNLWEKMQEGNIEPSKHFLNYLDLILKEKDNKDMLDSLQEFNEAIQNSDLIRARSLLDSIPIVFKSDTYSMLCHKYCDEKRFFEIVSLVRELKETYNLNLDQSTINRILKKMSISRNVYYIDMIGELLTPELKRLVDYNYYISQAHLKVGSWNLYLKKLESKLDNKLLRTEDLNIHSKTVIESLIKHPEFREQFESVAEKFCMRNIFEPMTACWMYYFLQRHPKADEIWREHLQTLSNFPWPSVINDFIILLCKSDIYLYPKLAELVQQSNHNRRNVKLYCYAKLITSCMKLDDPKKYEYSLQCLRIGLLEFALEEFDMNILLDLQNGLEKSGMIWPWLSKKDKPSTEDLIKALKT